MTHVLIVDDEADIRESLEAILREENYAVTSTGSVEEAKKVCMCLNRPNLIRRSHLNL